MYLTPVILPLAFICFTILFSASAFAEGGEPYASSATSAVDGIPAKYGYSIEEEREIGFQSAVALIKRYGRYKNKEVNSYITSIGENLAKNVSKRPLIKYRFIILDSDEANAFSSPGGYVFITKGLLKTLYNEAEAASILAHEIAHVENGDGLESISKDPALKAQLLSIRQSIVTNEGLNQNFESLLDGELKKPEQKSHPVVNVDNLKTLNEIRVKK